MNDLINKISEKAKARLEDFGITIKTKKEELTLNYIAQKKIEEIKSYCNIDVISSKLEIIATENICGEYLKYKKYNDENIIEKLNKASVKSMKIGDTSTTFESKSKSSEERYDEIIKYLIFYGEDILNEYRSIKW